MPLDPPLQASQACIAEIEKDEGFEAQSYPDPHNQTKTWAIGFGTNEDWVKPGMTCTRSQAEGWLMKKVHSIEDVVNRAVNVPLKQYQFDSLVNFTYNVGEGQLTPVPKGFLGSTLLRKLNAGDYDGASHEFIRWIYAGGKKDPNLLKRRKEEEAEFDGQSSGPENPPAATSDSPSSQTVHCPSCGTPLALAPK